MNFNYGYNFDLRAAKLEEKKIESNGSNVEETEGTQSSAVAPETTVVLTGDALELQAVLAKATVPGAANPKPGAKDDPVDWEQLWGDFLELKDAYNQNSGSMDYQDKIDALNEMLDILNDLQDCPGIPQDLLQQVNSEYAETMQDRRKWNDI